MCWTGKTASNSQIRTGEDRMVCQGQDMGRNGHFGNVDLMVQLRFLIFKTKAARMKET